MPLESLQPFLLNVMTNHHITTYRDSDLAFVDKVHLSIYVDVVLGVTDVESAHQFYLKSNQRLAEGWFKLRMSVTNSDDSCCIIEATI